MTRKLLLIATLLAAFATHMALATQNAPQAPAATGTLQGTVTREGTTEPIPDVQIAVFGKSYGQAVINPQLAQQMLDDPTRFRISENTGTGSVNRGAALSPEEITQMARDAIANGSRGGTPLPALTTITDSNGHFSIANVPVGDANVRALAPQGYFAPAVSGVYPQIASKTVTVTAEKIATVQISLLPGGSISGRATDTNGKPLSELQVMVLQVGYTDGRLALQLADEKKTDDRGEYRMYSLPPGEYFIEALPRPSVRDAAPVVAGEIPVRTFYPGVTDQARAVPIVLKSGDDLLGVNLPIRTGAAATISGKVTTTLPPVAITGVRGGVREMIPSVSMTLHEPDALSEFSSGGAITVNAADGTFQIPGVAPGTYDLFARLPIVYGWGAANPPERAATAWAIGRTTVEVRGSNVDNVIIAVNPGVDVKGRITVDGRPSVPNLRLLLQSPGSEANLPDGQIPSIFGQISSYPVRVEADGSFTYPALPPARYRFNAMVGGPSLQAPSAAAGGRGAAAPALPPVPTTPLPANAYLADIRQGSVSVYDNGLVVGTQAATPLDVMVKTDGGSIDGNVLGADRKPVAAGTTVVLIPPDDRRQNPSLYKTSRTDAQGHFTMNAIPPGAYKLYAWDNVKSGAWQNAEFMQQFDGRGAVVKVSPNAKTTAEVVLIK